MKQKWKQMQFVEISMHEIFCLQDRLDSVKDDPEKVWEIFDNFLMECENQLGINPGFLKELQELDLEKDFIKLNNLKDLISYLKRIIIIKTAKDYVEYLIGRNNGE